MLWLCLRLEKLPLEALCQERECPVVIVAKRRVVNCNDIAAEYGVRQGLALTTAHELLADHSARWLDRNPVQEQETLKGLLGWAYSFTPVVGHWHKDCLLLEIGGCLRLFGGVQPLLSRALTELARRGVTATPGLAATRRGAWLLTYAPDDIATDHETPLLDRIKHLPLALLNEFKAQVDALARAGIHQFGALLSLPQPALKRRINADFRTWLDQLTGHQPEPVRHHEPPASFKDALWLGFAIQRQDELLPAMRELLAGLCNFLRHTQLQTQQIQWQLVNTRGNRSVLDVRSQSAGQDLECWLALSQLRLDAMTKHIRDIEGLVLNVEQLTPQNHTTEDLLSDRGQREPIQALVDRLRNRLGLQAIHHVNSRPEHLPEHCSYTDTERADPPTPIPHGTQRPFWLLSQPQPIQRRQGQLYWHGPLKVLHGPERIEDNWWQSPVSRDYYIAQGENGEPLWIFQNRHSRRWYLHGLFD